MIARIGLLLAALCLLAGPGSAPAGAAEAASTTERKAEEKAQRKKDKEFNREILFRQVVGPDVLALGPYTISLFVEGQPVEGRVRIAVQAADVAARTTLEGQKWAINGIIYPLAVRMYERGRPTTEDISLFKSDAYDRLAKRYPEMVSGVYIESLL